MGAWPAVGYQRPTWPPAVCHDDQGQVIPYGNRWAGSPPDDAYSRVTNQQRFAPLLTVTAALIEHLRAEYQVTTSITGSVTELDPGPAAARLRFAVDPDTFVVRLTAGPVAQFGYPVCACDACDETAEAMADDLEATVFAVVAGHLRQRVGPPPRGKGRTGLVIEVGGAHASSSWTLLDRAERRRIRDLLRGTPERWEPWTRR